jgi:hypothetical protein
VHERREPLSGDYGYDMHEVEYDRDMSYDEAHDFQGR